MTSTFSCDIEVFSLFDSSLCCIAWFCKSCPFVVETKTGMSSHAYAVVSHGKRWWPFGWRGHVSECWPPVSCWSFSHHFTMNILTQSLVATGYIHGSCLEQRPRNCRQSAKYLQKSVYAPRKTIMCRGTQFLMNVKLAVFQKQYNVLKFKFNKLVFIVKLTLCSISLPNFMALSFQIRGQGRVFSPPKGQTELAKNHTTQRNRSSDAQSSLSWVGFYLDWVEWKKFQKSAHFFDRFSYIFVDITRTTRPISKKLVSLDLSLRWLRNVYKFEFQQL